MTANHAAPKPDGSRTSRPDWAQIKSSARVVAGWDSTARVRDLVEVSRQVNAPVPSGRRIVVVGTRRGAGSTTVAALVTSLLAHRRRDPVLAVDGAGPTGLHRLDMVLTGNPYPAVTIQQVAAQPPVVSSRNQLDAHLVSAGGQAWLLPQSTANPDHAVDTRTYDAAVRAFGRLFDFTITDLGAAPAAGLAPMLLQQAHAICVVVPAESDALHLMDAQLRQLFGTGSPSYQGGQVNPALFAPAQQPGPVSSPSGEVPWAGRVTVVVNDAPRLGREFGEYRRRDPRLPATIARLRRRGMTVVQFRSDYTLKMSPLTLDTLSVTTQRAAVRLTAALLGTAAPAMTAPSTTSPSVLSRSATHASAGARLGAAADGGWVIDGSLS